ncbi:MAG: ferric reductase-like transmembrane domain-containing protein [Lautropia sp.]
MTPTRASPGTRLRALAAPAWLALVALASVWWAWPGELARWRASSIVAAWAGTGLLVGSLALMVREPRWARWMGGLDTMYRWHHRSGVVAYVLLLAHPLALAVAGWAESPRSAWAAIAPWAQSWPVWLGWGGLGALMLGLARAFSRSIGYRRWLAFHYLTALGVVLGLAHVFVLLGEAAVVSGLVAIAVLALVWRLLVTDRGVSARAYRVTQVAKQAAEVIEVTVAPCAAAGAGEGAASVVPGQFVLLALADARHDPGAREFHPFSVTAIGPGGALSVGIKALGPWTRRIQSLRPGVAARLQGPFGRFLDDRDAGPELWIAGGIGIAPFVAAIREAARPHPTTLVYLFRDDADAAYLSELRERAAADPSLDLIASACGDRVPDVAAILSGVSGLADRRVRICGPPGLVKAVRASLQRLGHAPDSIHDERFDFR